MSSLSILFLTTFLSGTVAWASPTTFLSSINSALVKSFSSHQSGSIPSPSPSVTPLQRYPYNLRRLYDGSWEVKDSSPFSYIPSASQPESSAPPNENETQISPSPALQSDQRQVEVEQKRIHQKYDTENIRFNSNDSIYKKVLKSASRSINNYLYSHQRNKIYNKIHSNHNNLKQSSNISPNNSTLPSSLSRLLNVSFQKNSGFALLTVENHESPLSKNLNIVFGDLILRDGVYRTQRDVSLHLTGLYELSTGTLVLVGDVLRFDANYSLTRLYNAFLKTQPNTTTSDNSLSDNQTTNTPYNITENRFVAALTQTVEDYKNKLKRGGESTSSTPSIASQCPFTASFSITPGNYDDTVPSEATENVNNFGMGMNLDNGIRQNDDKSIVLSGTGPSIFSSEKSEVVSYDDGFNAQDEYVEMKGKFSSEVCQTEMSIFLTTLDTETLFGKAINYTLLVTIVAFIQVIVLIRQMEMTSTQAGARRVSLMTVGLQAVADSYLCLGHLTMGIAVQTLFNAFATAAFFKFICFSIFLMRWMLLIWKARRPSGFSEGWEAMRRELSMLYSRFYGALLLGIFLLYQLQNHIRLFVFALYSFWLPQVILNAVEDHRRPLLPIYIIATSITRLAIPLYFWGCPYNFLHIEPQPVVALSLVCWLFVQATMLLSQYKFGPRWFIPKRFLPEKYDYFREIVVEDDEVIDLENCENGANRPLVGSVEHTEARRECCICMESVAIHSRDRMVTPCNHFFHAACLERWLEVRLECALCRSPVPPP